MPSVTLSVQDMALPDFLRYVATEYDVSVIAASKLDDTTVTVEVHEQSIDTVLSLVGRRLNVRATKVGGMWFLGDLVSEDRGVLVRKVQRLSAGELKEAASVLLSEIGRVSSYPDGLVVVADRVDVLGHVSAMIDQIERAPAGAWVVQLYLVLIRNGDTLDAGVDVIPAADLAVAFAAASQGMSVTSASIDARLSAVARADRTQEGLQLLAWPTFLLLDGQTGISQDGDEFPIREPVFDERGQVVSERVQYIRTGMNYRVQLRELGNDRAKLDVRVDLGQRVGESAAGDPIINRQVFETVSEIRDGGVYLLGSVERSSDRKRAESITSTAWLNEIDQRTLQLWAKCYQVSGPIKQRELQ